MKFSLILPTYKVANYITTCLESCCNQTGITPKDYEIIIINDESPDNSIEVAQKVIDRYPEHNWKIVNRKNGGLSAARNSGICEAQGDYLWFIDSDDFIEKNALSALQLAIRSGDYDIINFTHKTVYKNNHIVGGNKIYAPYEIKGVDYLSHTNFLSAWTCIYKRNFLEQNQLRFKEGVIWEDSEFNTRAYMLTNKNFCICDALYYYIRRENSISDIRATPFSTSSRISNAYDLDTYFKNKEIAKEELGVAYSKIASMLVSAIAGLPELEESEHKHFRKEIRRNKKAYFNIMTKCGNLLNKLILISYMILPTFSENLLNQKIRKAIRCSIT